MEQIQQALLGPEGSPIRPEAGPFLPRRSVHPEAGLSMLRRASFSRGRPIYSIYKACFRRRTLHVLGLKLGQVLRVQTPGPES